MKKLLVFFFTLSLAFLSRAQSSVDTLNKKEIKANADDPSQFLTRVEIFSEWQHYGNDIDINQTVFRAIVKFRKRFTTRIDIPYVHNSYAAPGHAGSSGMGDISFRLLGYQVIQKPLSAITASVEVSLNTAGSPLLGTGKNLVIPVVTYSRILKKTKTVLSIVGQQTNAISGDKNRANVSFSKLQVIVIQTLSPKSWIVIAPECYVDYVHGGVSMNMRSRLAYAPIRRVNIWITPSVGIFGDFIQRYQWSLDIGGRYFLFRNEKMKKSNV